MMLARRIRRAVPSTRPRIALRLPRGKAAPPRASASAPAAVGGAVFGAILAFFLDPKAGRRRRHAARDRVLSRARRGERRALARARRAESHAVGIARRTFNTRRFRHPGPVDDITLAHKVESELARSTSLPKGQVVVNAEEGVVFLRGVVERQEDIESLEAATSRIAGVRGVENLLHPPGTPAPASRPKLERERSDH
jgi:hyperosmotically inducible protein